MISLCKLLSAVIGVTQKGSHIASIIRSDRELLELLVQEKANKEKNHRFEHDFKTLADVVIQEMVRHDLSKEFAGIESRIYGEESSTFTNTLGETVTVNLQNTTEETKTLLCNILDGNSTAAGLLAEAVHAHVSIDTLSTFDHITGEIPLSDICVWIDPIDSTAQYIHGQVGRPNEFGIVDEGLQCVTILVGVYHRVTGLPVIGVVVQPFAHLDDTSNSWKSETYWGVSYNDSKFSSLDHQTVPRRVPTLIMSTSESDDVRHKLSKDFSLQYAAGAGYKLLCVARGLVDAYVLSKASIFNWDCCSPHSILLALGGGVVAFSEILSGDSKQVKYNYVSSAEQYSIAGIVAYRSKDVLDTVIKSLKS